MWEHVVNWLRNPKLLADLLQPPADTQLIEVELSRTDVDLVRIRTGQENLLRVLEQGAVSNIDDVLDRLNRLKKQETALLTQRASLQQTLLEESRSLDWEAYRTLAQNLLQSIEQVEGHLTFEDKREIIHQFIKEIVVGHDTGSSKATIPTVVQSPSVSPHNPLTVTMSLQ